MSQASSSYDLTLILPWYREDTCVFMESLDKLRSLRELISMQIIVVRDGGETDGLHTLVQNDPGILIIGNACNRGKGFSVRRGVEHACGKFICYSDIDLPVSTASIVEGLRQLQERNAQLIIGNRFGTRSVTNGSGNIYRKITSRWFRRLYNILLEPQILDSQCPMKIMSNHLAKRLFSHSVLEGYAFDAEILHIARLSGVTPLQLDVQWIDARAPWTRLKTLYIFGHMILDLLFIRCYWAANRSQLYRTAPETVHRAID